MDEEQAPQVIPPILILVFMIFLYVVDISLVSNPQSWMDSSMSAGAMLEVCSTLASSVIKETSTLLISGDFSSSDMMADVQAPQVIPWTDITVDGITNEWISCYYGPLAFCGYYFVDGLDS
ncbi:hypothetical protein WICPIJ_002738 [Wickerhamomyces pijperi]|uniref:Uncharacterized protein n=1 Tax=Wickerhamomyces pijperi TaxID=599730 RepID=A0A9P8QB94_WICPI|nr:hypothetical protein WICPIJ_002738 [Wickerhamomyces pijperi]